MQADGDAWFVTADDVDARRLDDGEPAGRVVQRLGAALRSARALRDLGLDFVVAPTQTIEDDIVHVVGNRWVVAIYPFVHGTSHDYGPHQTDAQRLAVVDRLTSIHTATNSARQHAFVDDFTIPHRAGLRQALAEEARWDGGPYSEPARRLVRDHAKKIESWLTSYDEAASQAVDRRGRMVLTHGEPHAGNTLDTPEGVVLIDWDTALIAPPERDLWSLALEDASVLDRYSDLTGVEPLPNALDLYRLRWDLAEVAEYVRTFRHEHGDDADTRTAWRALAEILDGAARPLRDERPSSGSAR
jgi:spectinomycin phosphotransferase/16S rRNA (guanine(1405)-N(7))-methyltransferase